jgi:hypothetical protein
MKVLFSLIVFFLLSSASVFAQDKYVGTWEIKEVVSDPDSISHDRTKAAMVITKVTDEYYRSTINNNSLLYKVMNDSTIYSNFSPEREVLIIWKSNGVMQVTAKVINEEDHKPAVMIWVRKEE